jgi:predicted metalloendopeptidase
MLKENKVDQWKAYMRWSLLNRASSQLSEYWKCKLWVLRKTLTGAVSQRDLVTKEQNDQWNGWRSFRKIIRRENFRLRPKPKAKNDQNIFLAFENRINNLSWMSAETKVSALAKLNKSRIKLGILTSGKTILPWQSKSKGGTILQMHWAWPNGVLKKILLSWTNQ